MSRIKDPISLLIAILLFAVIFLIRFYYPVHNIISWDTFGYYLYLPASFIYQDPGLHDLSWVQHLIDTYQPTSSLYQIYAGIDGAMVIKYPVGFALLYSPFFFMAHWLSPLLGFPADGLSAPYQYLMTLGAMIYTLAGLLCLRKLLLNFFNDKLSALIILLIVAGTNYLQMASDTSLLTHNLLFGLYALILLLTLRWHKSPGAGVAFLLGLSIGLATIVRPTDGLLILVPLLWGVFDKPSLGVKMKLLLHNYKQVGFFILGAFLMGLPQLLYWKYTTGQFLFYSYQNPGEGLDFMNPHTLDFLFSFRKGWLVYSPLMIVALIGFYYHFTRHRQSFAALVVFVVVYIYVVSSWSCWWYPGTLGQRPMVETYSLLALPMGFFLLQIKDKSFWIRVLIGSIISLFVILNLFQTWQFSQKIIHPERMTKAYYFKTFGQLSVNEEDKKLLLIDRPGGADEVLQDTTSYNHRVLFYENFENLKDTEKNQRNDSLSTSGNFSIRIDSVSCFSPAFSIPFLKITSAYYAWIRVRLNVYPFADPGESQGMVVMSFEHKGGSYKYKAVDIADTSFKTRPGQWNKITVDFITPEVRSKDDILKIYFWLRGKKPVLIDDMNVCVFDKPGQ